MGQPLHPPLPTFSLLLAPGLAGWRGRPPGQTDETLARIASGDLTVDVRSSSRDEVGQLMSAMKHMVENLRTMIARTVEIAGGIASASTQLQATSEQIAT